MIRVGHIQIEPLSSKHYSTNLSVEVGGNGWDKGGYRFTITISGVGTQPSIREYEKGYYEDDGMNHVESQEHYELAVVIMDALRKFSS